MEKVLEIIEMDLVRGEYFGPDGILLVNKSKSLLLTW